MAAAVRAQVRIPFGTGLPEDVATNTWHFTRATGTFDDLCDALVDGLAAFYGEIDNGMASYLDGPGTTIHFYNMLLPEPRVPRVESMLFDTPDNANFPSEVAIVMSFHGDAPVTARRRGRLYLGPLAASAGTNVTDQFCRPTAGFITAIGNGITEMGDAMSATPGVVWCVYSRANNDFVPVTRMWVNNEFDTQRRRGVDETSRTSVDITEPISG